MSRKTLLEVVQQYLNTDASPLQLTSSEVACAESVTYLLKLVYPETPIITGTATLYEWMKHDPSWKQVSDPQPEDVIISPTGYGNGTITGHTGIITNDGLIASNNSYGLWKGKFTQNFVMSSWERRYKEKGGLPVFIFRHV